MQTDEEVGKLASATPVMICTSAFFTFSSSSGLASVCFAQLEMGVVDGIAKSLECFMQHLIEETCKETRARGSKKLTAYHLYVPYAWCDRKEVDLW